MRKSVAKVRNAHRDAIKNVREPASENWLLHCPPRCPKVRLELSQAEIEGMIDSADEPKQEPTLVERVIRECGSANNLSKALGVTPQAVALWKKKNHIPAERVLGCERASGVSRTEIRPDLYPVE